MASFVAMQQKVLASQPQTSIVESMVQCSICIRPDFNLHPLERHMLIAEQILSTQKAKVDVLFGMANKAFEGMEKLVALNLQTTRAAAGKAAEAAKSALAIKNAQELLAIQASLLQPAAEKAGAYGRTLYELATTTVAEARKVAEAAAAEAPAKVVAGARSVSKGKRAAA